MKKLLMSLAIATLTLFTACTADNDNPVSPTPSKELAEYTILYYGYGGGDLDEALLEKQFDMFKGNPDSYKKVKVACQYRFSSVESLKENYIGYLEIIKAIEDMGQQTIRYVIDKRNENAANEVLLNPEYIYGQKDSHPAHVDSLTNFINWGTEACPAKHYILVIADHGNGYIPSDDLTFDAPAQTRSILIDDEHGAWEYFTPSLLKYAIGRANARMDVIYMDACEMNTIEYQFELKNLTDYLILSTLPTLAFGSSYNALIDLLAKNSDDIETALKEYNRAAVTTWDLLLAENVAAGYESVKWMYTDMTVTRTKNLDAFGVKLREFTDKLVDAYAYEEYKTRIDTITKHAFKVYCYLPSYDLIDYTKSIIHALPDVYGDAFEAEFEEAFNNCVVSQYCRDFLMDKGISINCSVMLGVEGNYYVYEFDEDDPWKIIYNYIYYADGKKEIYTTGQTEPEVLTWGNTLKNTYEQLEFDKVTGWSRWLRLNKQEPNPYSAAYMKIPVE